MNTRRMQISIVIALVGLILVGFAGCKGDSETATESVTPAATTTTAAVTQTTCPIMVGKPINKAISTDHDGKTVYFCCAGCVDKFKAEPEKYTKDLPQFKK